MTMRLMRSILRCQINWIALDFRHLSTARTLLCRLFAGDVELSILVLEVSTDLCLVKTMVVLPAKPLNQLGLGLLVLILLCVPVKSAPLLVCYWLAGCV